MITLNTVVNLQFDIITGSLTVLCKSTIWSLYGVFSYTKNKSAEISQQKLTHFTTSVEWIKSKRDEWYANHVMN